MNCITYILHMKMKIPLNACIINPTTLHNIEYEYKYESVYRIEWNFRTEPYEMSYLMGVAGGCMAAILLLVCLCIYAIKSKRCCFKGKLKEGGKTPKKKKKKANNHRARINCTASAVKAATIKTSSLIMAPVSPPSSQHHHPFLAGNQPPQGRCHTNCKNTKTCQLTKHWNARRTRSWRKKWLPGWMRLFGALCVCCVGSFYFYFILFAAFPFSLHTAWNSKLK